MAFEQGCQASVDVELNAAIDELLAKLAHAEKRRVLLGITGGPASGKSTSAAAVAARINERLPNCAIVVPMDGFHLDNERLQELGLLPLKGIPATFDADGFVNLLERLRSNVDQTVFCPRFDRSIEASIANDIAVLPSHRLCVVEGNYLLLEEAPWNRCRQLLDETWYLDVAEETLIPRLITRHQEGGKTADGARAKVESTDLPNARLIAQTKSHATRIIQPQR